MSEAAEKQATLAKLLLHQKLQLGLEGEEHAVNEETHKASLPLRKRLMQEVSSLTFPL